MGFDELDEALIRLVLRKVTLYTVLTNVEANPSWPRADIAKIGICHLTRAIHDTAHNSNFHLFEM
jgi:hypothetical protein